MKLSDPAHQRVLVVVFDALRPEFVTREFMPNLHAFARAGVRYANSRSTFPSETRVNQSAVTTGCYPARHGVVANNFPVSDGENIGVLSTGDDVAFEAALKRMPQPLFEVPTLGEILAAAGRSYATLSAGTSGGGRLINFSAEQTGAFRFAMRRPEAAVPHGIADKICESIGSLPEFSLPALDWVSYAVECYLEFVEPNFHPDVMLLWLCEPDETFHHLGIGSPHALRTISHADKEFGRILASCEQEISSGSLQVIALSDHGQISLRGDPLDLESRFAEAGFGGAAVAGMREADIVVANAGGVWLREQNPSLIGDITTWLQQQDWCGPIFTRDGVGGTLTHRHLHVEHRRSPDIALCLRYDHSVNEWGHEGMSLHDSRYPVGGGCHGGMSSFELHNFIAMSGSCFKEACEVAIPGGNIDILPTILELLGVEPANGIDGRALREAFRDGPDHKQIDAPEKISSSGNDIGSITRLSTTEVNGSSYLNRAWVE